MRALALVTLAAITLTGSAAWAQRERGRAEGARDSEGYFTANPAKVVATELAFARAAQDKGQWTAFAEFAAKDAVMFTPQPVNARAYLKGRANPQVAVKWQPHQVWSSCDGSLAVTRGAWQRPQNVGYFTTVWARQKDGNYKWVMDGGDALKQPLAEPEMIGGKVAECLVRGEGRRRRGSVHPVPATIREAACDANGCRGGGTSADGTLSYDYSVDPKGGRRFVVQLRQDGAMREALRTEVAAQ